MEYINKITLTLMLMLATFSISAQTINFRTTKFSSNQYNTYTRTWSGWEEWQASDMLMTMDINNDVVIIYSPVTQVYKIYEINKNFLDAKGNYHVELNFIDQDYDKGIMRLVQRSSGASEVYIEFNNVKWCYRVIKIN